MVLDGLSTDPEQLLDSYSAEREPIDAATMEATGSATRTVLGNPTLFSTFAKYALPVLFSMDRVMKPFMANMLQIAVELPKESPLLPQTTPITDLIAPGQYIRGTVPLRKRLINKDDFERTTLHHLLQNTIPQYTILWVSSRSSCYSGNPLTRAFWSKFNDTYANPAATVKPIIVESAHHSLQNKLPTYVTTKGYEEAFWLEEHWDAEHSISNRIGLDKYLHNNKLESPPAAIIILRPDRYVAYSGLVNSTSDINTAFDFLGNYLEAK
ncbi:hypothetical protein BDA99DRAFT_185831 [Phascolomyces articulosus]|uniref:Uncharacterized protein n=1 Tax=Phascolomyces articulosus TaxID=60185 RepID=A0AAD5PAG0_9FUNG|nr:hypothetical protein BDA99DRAFT_185831 [Phascolomyces articulosus]